MLHAARLARHAAPALNAHRVSSISSTRLASHKASKPSAKAATAAAALAAARASSSAGTTSPHTPSKPASPASEQPSADNTNQATSSAQNSAPASSSPPPPPAAADATPTPPPVEPTPVPNLRSLDFTSTLDDAAIAAPTSESGNTDGAGGVGAGQRTGARSAKNSKSTSERKRGFMGRLALGVFAVGAGLFTWDLGREWTVDEVKAKRWSDDEVPTTRFDRTKARFKDVGGVFSEPQWEELLPAPQPGQKPMTLIVSLDDLLVSSTWDRQHGWRTAKRPGVDYFLAYLSQFYEVVVWTTQHHYTASPILEKLDPYHFFIAYQLFRESTRASPNGVVKDLKYLNRDLSKVIVLDTDPDVIREHAGNSIIIPKWEGAPGDHGLVKLIPFLESIGIYQPQDVRPVLEAYRGKDIPIEYAKTEAAMKAAHVEEHLAKRGQGGLASSLTLTGLFSSGPSGSGSSSGPYVPPMYLEVKRAEAQELYKREREYIEEHKAEFDRLLEEDRKAAMGETPANMMGYIQAISGTPPPPAAGAEGQAQAQAQGETSEFVAGK